MLNEAVMKSFSFLKKIPSAVVRMTCYRIQLLADISGDKKTSEKTVVAESRKARRAVQRRVA